MLQKGQIDGHKQSEGLQIKRQNENKRRQHMHIFYSLKLRDSFF